MKRKRVLCMLMTLCMIVGSMSADLTGGRNMMHVKAEETTSGTLSKSITLDFENETADTAPTGWVENAVESDTGAANTSVTVVKESDGNSAVKMTQTADRDASYYREYSLGEEVTKAVLTYRFKVPTGTTNYVYLPTFAYSKDVVGAAISGETVSTPLKLYLQNSGNLLAYSVRYANWVNVVTDLKKDSWHTVKEVVDLKNNVRELYVDGRQIFLDQTLSSTNSKLWTTAYPCDKNATIDSVVMGFNQAGTGTVYIDDISVTAFVEGTSVTFNATEVTMAAGETFQLKPTFVPADTSVQGVTYASSDTNVVTVDKYGVLTGVAVGTATVTATPANGLAPVTITVTVKQKPTIPFTLTFDELTAGTTPEGWTPNAANPTVDESKTSVKVADDAVKMTQTAARDASYYLHYNFEDGVKKAVLTYRFKAVSGKSETSEYVKGVYLPTFAYNSEAVSTPLGLILENGGNLLQYRVKETLGWTTGKYGFAKDSWHTVKEVVDLTNNVRELYLDGTQIILNSTQNTYPCDSTATINSVVMGFNQAGTGTVYIDDVSVTAVVKGTSVTFNATEVTIKAGETFQLQPTFVPADTSVQGMTYASSDTDVVTVDKYGLLTGVAAGTATITATPAQAGLDRVEITVTVTQTPKIPFTLTFDELEVDTTPDGWVENAGNAAADADKSSMKVAAESETNKMVELTQTAARGSQYFMHYYFEDADKAVMTYRFKAKAGSGTIWLPCFAYNGSAKSPLNLVLNNGSTLQYSGVRDYWQTAVTGLDSGWHTVREVVDLKNNVRELWIDGSYIALNAANMEKYPCDSAQTMNSVVAGFYSAATSGTIYLDDVSVTAFVDGTSVSFGETEITLPKGASIELQPEFVPEGTSVQGITYVSGDTSIATVDANGVVTAIADGQAVITATSALFPSNPIQITVTVSGEITGSITVDQESVSLPVDGHLYLNADLSFEGGVMADGTVIYTSADPSIATVDEWGEVLAVAAGTTTIKAQSVANPAIQAEIPVEVTDTTVWKTIYVSVNGTGDGTSAETPTTLAGAIAQLAAIDKAAMEGNIEVVLADGYYYQSETIKLNDAHGGNNRYSVIFRAEADGDTEQPVIGGGIQIEGSAFTETATKGVYVYDLTKLGFAVQTRQLFVDSVRATRARSEGTLKNPEYLYDANGTNIGLICDNTELLDYGRIQDLEMVSFNQWAHTRGQVAEIRKSSDGRVELIMDQPGWYNLTRVAEFMAMRPDTIVYYENALELLDEAGEWYLDEGDQKLYYMPRVWENMSQVEFTVPIMDGELITVEGTGSDQQVQNIRFDGITFADTTWLRPSTNASHPANQNNHLNDEKEFVDAAITVKKANSVNFLNCTFVRLGINAINMYEGVQNSLVSGCHFYDISGNAVAIGKYNYKTDVDNYNPTDVKKMMKNCDVINNYIHDIGVDYLSSSAVSVGFAANVDLCNNEIFDIPYCGFHIGYGWNTKFANITKNINISNNFIHDLLNDGIYDGGGIYTNGPTDGSEDNYNVVSGNYIKNQGEKIGPLYADEGSSYWAFTNNVVDTSETLVGEHSLSVIRWGYVNNNSGSNVLMANNYSTTYRSHGESAEKNIVFRDNTIVEDLNWPEEALEIIEASGLQQPYYALRGDQAEKIVTALPDEALDLKAGSTFDLQVRATDGKDRAVSLENAIVAYEILDESVATVSENGIITAVADGKTVVRIYVVSNDVLDVVERDVYVGDDIEELCLKDVAEEVSLYLNSKGKQLEAYGVTESNREVTFETLTYSVEDTKIATVDENGYLKPAAVGTTVLTVTGSAGGYTVTETFTVTIKQPISAEIDYLEEVFEKENESNWVGGKEPASWELIDGQTVSLQLDGYTWRTYAGETYQNELLTFNMRVDDKGGWPGMVLRAQSSTKGVAYGETGYIICMGDNGLQVQRFNGSTRTVFYGNVAGFTALLGGDIYPHALSDKAFHEIQVGAINEENGVRLVMYIDGEEIFNFLDESEDAITEAGYFGFAGYNDIFVLERIVSHGVTLPEGFTGSANVTDGEDYTFAVAETDSAYYDYTVTAKADGESVTVIDNGDGTYTVEAVTGELIITGTRTAKSYDVTIEGTARDDIQNAAAKAVYGVAYTFTLPTVDGFEYKLEALTIGGAAYTDYTADGSVYTIPGAAITGEIKIVVTKTAVEEETTTTEAEETTTTEAEETTTTEAEEPTTTEAEEPTTTEAEEPTTTEAEEPTTTEAEEPTTEAEESTTEAEETEADAGNVETGDVRDIAAWCLSLILFGALSLLMLLSLVGKKRKDCV